MFNKEKAQNGSRLGNLLIEKRLINNFQLKQALTHQKSHDLKLGESLLQLGFIKPNQLEAALSRQSAMRSLCTGLIFFATPWCQVMANEKPKSLTDNDPFNWNSPSLNTAHEPTALSSHGSNKYTLGVNYSKSFKWGLELEVSQSSIHINGDELNQWVPQITLFGSRASNKHSSWPDSPRHQSKFRYDRYKNTIPMVYRLTIKGYSLFEASDSKSQYLAFERHTGHYFKNYDIMFSLTKQFD